MTLALNRYKTLLTYTNSDAASLTWQDASKLVADGKAAFNVMGDWADGYFRIDLKKKPKTGYGWAADSGHGGIYDWLSDSFTLPKGAPHRAAAVQWLGFLGSKRAQDTFNPVKGSIPARQDANPKLYDPYLKWALAQWKTNKLAGSLAHGVVASNAWNTDIDTALGLFLQSKDVKKFQTSLVRRGEQEHVGATGRTTSDRMRGVRRWGPGLLLVSPSIILIAVFVYGLIGWNVRVSTSDWRTAEPDERVRRPRRLQGAPHRRALEPRPPPPLPLHDRVHHRDAPDRGLPRAPARQGREGRRLLPRDLPLPDGGLVHRVGDRLALADEPGAGRPRVRAERRLRQGRTSASSRTSGGSTPS